MDNRKKWEEKILSFYQFTTFLDLIIESDTMEQSTGTVTFHAILMQEGKSASFREESLFEKMEGKWYYVSGVYTGRD